MRRRNRSKRGRKLTVRRHSSARAGSLRLTREVLEDRRLLAVLTYDIDLIDDVTLQLNAADVEVVETGNPTNVLAANPLVDTDRVVINGDADANNLTIDPSFFATGLEVDFSGIAATGDVLTVVGSGSEAAVFTPDPLFGNGTVVVDGQLTNFNAPVDITGMATATWSSNGIDEDLTIENGMDFGSGTIEAWQVTGNSGGLPIEPAAFFSNGEVVIETATVDGDDLVTVISADNAHDNTALTIVTGDGLDAVNLDGDVLLANPASELRVQTQDIQIGGELRVAALVVLDAGNGAIVDDSPSESANIVATAAALNASMGIGSGDDLNTETQRVAFSNAVSGDVQLTNDGGLAIDSVDVFSTSTAATDVAIITTQGGINNFVPVSIGGRAEFRTTNAGDDIVLDTMMVNGTMGLTTGPLGDATITSNGAIDFADVNVGGDLIAETLSGDIRVGLAISVTANGTLTFLSDANIEIAASATVTANQGSISFRGDAHDASGGTIIDVFGNLASAVTARLEGNSGADVFNIAPDDDTPIDIDGMLSLAGPPGDVLNLDLAGVADANVAVMGVGAISISSTTHATVSTAGIETFEVANGTFGLLVDTNQVDLGAGIVGDDGMPEIVNLELDSVGDNLLVDVNSAPVFAADSSDVRHVEVIGSNDDDTLSIVETTGGLPDFPGDLSMGGQSTSGHRNAAFTTSGLTNASGDQNIGIHFDAAAGSTNQLLFDFISAQNVSYFSDSDGATNSGNINIESQVNISFSGLTPLVFAGAGGTLTVDATSTPATTTLTVSDDLTDTAGAGGNMISGDGGFETTFFNGFEAVEVRGGDGDDTIAITTLDLASSALGIALTSITLDGNNTGGSDAGNDTLEVQTLPATIAAELNGAAGNDTFMLGDPTNSLDGLLGTIIIDGGDENPLPTSESVTAKDLTITANVDEGDTLILKDQGDSDDNSYTLTDTTFDRSGSGQVMFSELETIELLATMGIATVEVSTTPDNSKTTITTQGLDDTVTITDSGDTSILLVNTAAGMDTVAITTTGMASVTKVDSGADHDAFTVTASGEDSGLELNGGESVDTFTVQSTGGGSALRINAGADDDLVTVNDTGTNSRLQVDGDAGADAINMAGSGVESAAQLNGGADNDTFMLGDPVNSLDGLLGTVMIDGGDENPLPTSESVTAKDLTITANVDEGDTLILKDQGDSDDNSYTLTDATFDRSGSGQVMFSEIETIELLATMGIATVEVSTTPDNSKTTITTQEQGDTVTITASGDTSILLVNTAGGMDTVAITTTGMASVTKVDSGADNDAFTVTTSGEDSGLELNGGEGVDTFTVQSTGGGSALRINAGADDDLVTVNDTGTNSRLQVDGDAGADTIKMAGSSVGSAAQLNGGANNDIFMLGDPVNSLDGLLGTVMIDGGDENPLPTSESVTAKDLTITANVDEGDTLILKDQGDSDDNSYTLTDTTFDRSGSGQVKFSEIETIELLATMGIATVDVSDTPDNSKTTITTQEQGDTVAITASGDTSILLVNTAAGMDTVATTTTGMASVTKVNSGADNDTFTVANTGDSSGLELNGSAGTDTLTIQSAGGGSALQINAGADDDLVTVNDTGTNSRLQVDGDAGADTINMAGSGVGSAAQLNGGADNDTFMLGDPVNSLDGLLGTVMIDGGDENPLPTSESVTAKDLTITANVDEGDTLILKDQGDSDDNSYTLTDTTFDRSGSGQVMFSELETIELLATMGIATVEVSDTPDNSKTTITTQDLDDTITITASGDTSILLVNTAAGMDTVAITTTGMASVTKVDSGTDNDAFTTTASGKDSGLELNGSAGTDTLTFQSTGGGSALRINAGADDDLVTVSDTGTNSRLQVDGDAGADTINMASSGVGSAAQLNGGANNDTFMLGDPVNSLDGLLGSVMIDGGDENPLPTSESVTAKDLTITANVDEGDTLILKDQGDSDDNSYTLTDTTFDRSGSGQVMFSELETIELLATMGIATVEVSDAPDNSKTTITTQDLDDTITITASGDTSILLVNTAAGMDTVAITTTGGMASVTKVDSGVDNDTITVTDTGDQSGLEVRGAEGEDTLTVHRTGMDSATKIEGGADNDTINVSSPTGSLSDIDGALQINGGGNSPITEESTRIRDEGFVVDDRDGTRQTAPWDKYSRYQESDSEQPTGDTLNVFDSQTTDDSEYEVARLDSATETGSGTIQRVGGPCVWFEAAETFNLQTGSNNDQVEVFLPPTREELPQIITVDGNSGQNQLTIIGSDVGDAIIIGDLVTMTGEIRDPFEVHHIQFLYILAAGGDDVVHNDSGATPATTLPAKSLIDGGVGDDILVGGPEVDSIFGGLGADAIFGNEGSDYLFGDVNLEGTIVPEAGDVVFGNLGFGNDTGFRDSGVVLVPPGTDTDYADEIEYLIEEGAQKGVWSWLLATFPEFSLEPNGDGTFSSPEIDELVDEALSVFPGFNIEPPLREDCATHGDFDAMDVNRDGFVAPLDAMIIVNALHDVTLASRAMDVNRDGHVAPLDALMVINHLSAASASAAARPAQAPASFGAGDQVLTRHEDEETPVPQHVAPATIGPPLIRPTDLSTDLGRQFTRRSHGKSTLRRANANGSD